MNNIRDPMMLPGHINYADGIIRQAQLSPCENYRLYLYREVIEPDYAFHPNLLAAFYMVNPSTADSEEDDHTIRKLYGFARMLSVSRFMVVNLCTYRTPDVKLLRSMSTETAVGPEADDALELAMKSATYHVVGWGSLKKLPEHLQHRYKKVVELSNKYGRTLFCFGVNKDGHPSHPCMTGYDTPRAVWTPPA